MLKRHKSSPLKKSSKTVYIMTWWDYLFPHGMTKRINALVSLLKENDITPQVITPIFFGEKEVIAEPETKNIKSIDIRWVKRVAKDSELINKVLGISVFSVFSCFSMLSAIIKNRKTPIVIQYQDVFSGIPAVFCKVILGATIIGDDLRLYSKNYTGFMAKVQKMYEIWLLRNTTYVTTSFKLDYKIIRQILPEKNVFYVPNGIENKSQPKKPRNWKKAVFTGSFTDLDNIASLDTLTFLAKGLNKNTYAAKIFVVGGPAEIVKSTLKSLDPDGLVVSLGRLPQKEFDALYDEVAIGLLPYYEKSVHSSQRIKALEYFANGLLVITSPKGVDGIGDALEGEHYLLAKSPEEMLDILKKVVLNPSNYALLASNGKALMQKNYSWNNTAKPYLLLVKSLFP